MGTAMEILLQELVFSIRLEVYPRYELGGLSVFHPEDGGDLFLRNVSSYKNHTKTNSVAFSPQANYTD
jgi:hypothetical protein